MIDGPSMTLHHRRLLVALSCLDSRRVCYRPLGGFENPSYEHFDNNEVFLDGLMTMS